MPVQSPMIVHMTLNRDIVDGVPVFWVEGPPPLSAELLFRVGVRDESLIKSGITHLAEHAVMRSVPEPRHDHNASVELTFTSFEATGRPDQIVAFLENVCQSISAPDLSSLDIEKKVLAAEAASVVEPAVAEHLLRRYGLSSLGLAGVDQPALNAIDEESVRQVISQFFTRGNAALALTGPPPSNLALPLQPGEAQPPAPANPIASVPTPYWLELGGPPLALSFEVEAGTELARNSATAAGKIACERANAELRHKRGMIYDVDYRLISAGTGRGVLCIMADPRKADAEPAYLELRRILQELATEGPGEAELRQHVEDATDYSNDPRTALFAASDAARRHLLGEAPIAPEQFVAGIAAVTPQTVRESLALLDSTLIVGMPQGTSSPDPSLRMLGSDSHEPVSGRTFKRGVRGALQGVPANARLIIGDEGISLADSLVTTIRWDDVRGLEYMPHGIILHGADAVSLEIHRSWFAKGQEALELVEQRVDAAVAYQTEPA